MSKVNIASGAAAILVASLLLMFPASVPAQSLTKEMAKRHYQNGAAYYERANYTMALEEFERAYRLETAPELLYNMGRCHEGLGQLDRAIQRFEAFLKAKPDANNAPVVQARIVNLRKQLEARKPGPTPAPAVPVAPPEAKAPEEAPAPPPPTPTRERATLKLAGWAALGAGAAVMTVGGILGGMASRKTGEYEDGYARHMAYEEAQEILNQAQGLETGMFVCLGVGAAAAATGAVLLILDSRKEAAPATARAGGLRIRPTLSGLALDF